MQRLIFLGGKEAGFRGGQSNRFSTSWSSPMKTKAELIHFHSAFLFSLALLSELLEAPLGLAHHFIKGGVLVRPKESALPGQ